METVIAIACAVVSAITINYAVYLQKKALATLPEVKFQLSWPVLKAFITNRTWMASIAIILAGGGVYAVAMTLAPVSVVQPIIGSGVAFLAYLAIKNLGERPRRIDLYAIGLNILGVILIGVSLLQGIPESVPHDNTSLWIFTGVLLLLAVTVPILMRGRSGTRQAAGLGISVGLLYGMAAIFAKLMLVDWKNQWPDKGLMVVFSSIFLIAWLMTLLPGFGIMQAALQKGLAVVVVPIVTGLAQLVPIIGGAVALKEPFPENPFLTALRILAFCMILTGTIILSKRAEEAGPDTAVESGIETTAETAVEILE